MQPMSFLCCLKLTVFNHLNICLWHFSPNFTYLGYLLLANLMLTTLKYMHHFSTFCPSRTHFTGWDRRTRGFAFMVCLTEGRLPFVFPHIWLRLVIYVSAVLSLRATKKMVFNLMRPKPLTTYVSVHVI